MQDHDIDRRTLLRWTGAATATGTLALAGCAGTGDDGSDETETDDANETGETDGGGVPSFPTVEDPPAAVYLPTHRESMRVLEPISAGDYALAPMLSYPHSFWLVAGSGGADAVQRVDPEEGRAVHMMFALWDDETGVVLPAGTDVAIRVYRDGERIGPPESPWPMLSQEMGFHFGDNVPLGEDGTYAVEVDLPPLSVRTTGDLEGRFTESATATFEFEYDREFKEQVTDGVEYLPEDRWGEPGALEPMAHDGVPYSALPPADAYPGTRLEAGGESETDLPRSGDAAVLATLLDSSSRLGDGDGRYLLVSPRTPYNRVPLSAMALRATVERDGDPVADAEGIALEETIDGEYGLHYGAELGDVRPGDSVTIAVESPPQVARHQGYETAFLEMAPLELTVPEGRR